MTNYELPRWVEARGWRLKVRKLECPSTQSLATSPNSPMPLSDQWTTVDVAGHPCHVFEPSKVSLHGYTILYLHGSSVENLADQPRVTRQLEQHGLRAIAPVTGETWWSDRITEEFDSEISVEQYILKQVLSYVAERWDCRPPQIALLGVSMGGQGALRLAYKHPNIFPTVAAFFPAIDFQKKIYIFVISEKELNIFSDCNNRVFL